MIDISRITNPEAKRFITAFLADREINREFYLRVPEDRFDFRMVNTPARKSDSPRESLAHQIDTTRDYINGVKTGVLKFNIKYPDLENIQKLSKAILLEKLEEGEKDLVEVLVEAVNQKKKVQVPWAKEPLYAVIILWSLDSHEILHTGWNLALMDFLNIERFPALKKMWG